ncbi:MAG: GGDEF domain-containing protein [Gammaproteobacteria bacterium]|jgi:diguanylate cyclase (GGDEF)-like protein
MTYRSRLLLYVVMLTLLLIGAAGMSFKVARDVVVAGTEDYLRHVGLRKEAAIRAQVRELERYTQVIAADKRLQEYLYIVFQLHGGIDALEPYYDRRFGYLPVDYSLLVSQRGAVLLGQGSAELVSEVQRQVDAGSSGNFFFQEGENVFMVAARPVAYRGEELATIVVVRTMDRDWMLREEGDSPDYQLFFERDGQVIRGSNARYEGQSIDPVLKRLDNDGGHFSLCEVAYAEADTGLPRLWYGVAESDLDQLLAGYRRKVYWFGGAGSLVVLLVGGLMLRNFNRPIQALMDTTEQMIKGELPFMDRSDDSTEMGRLVNRFADVLDALRSEQSKLELVNRKLQETAITDSLTGLYNRRYLQEVTPGLFAQVVRDKRFLTAVLLDLDHFKAINDSWGHLGGDAVLIHFARLLKHNSRANDFLFRIGGEEFLLLNVAEDPADSVALANKIRALVDQSPASYQGKTLPITVSAGVSCCYGKSGDASLSTLMRAADKALYEAKSAGRNRVILHSSCLDAAGSATRRRRITLIEGGARQSVEG